MPSDSEIAARVLAAHDIKEEDGNYMYIIYFAAIFS
jgi:hypothetical protein